jgi:hypothetical protein
MPSDDHDSRPAPSSPAYLSKRQLIARSGLSASTIQRYKDAAKIPFFQPAGAGGKLLFPPDAIELARAHAIAEQQAAAVTGVARGQHGQQAAETPGRRTLRGPRPRWQTCRPGGME